MNLNKNTGYSMNSQLFDEQFGVTKKLYEYLVSQKLNELNEAIRQHRGKEGQSILRKSERSQ